MTNYPIARRFFAAFSRYRPRVLTLIVLAAIAGWIVLVNLSEENTRRKLDQTTDTPAKFEFDLREPSSDEPGSLDIFAPIYWNMSYGWPLHWRQYVIEYPQSIGFNASVLGECRTDSRLAGNVALWLIMLGAPAGACEWLLRRYRPHFRFSMRTMLAATAFAAVLCAWFAWARNRANMQELLIESIQARNGCVWVEHDGPKWLEHLGIDHYRRRIVGAHLNIDSADDQDAREGRRLLGEFKRLPDLRFLVLAADRVTAETAGALSELTHLRTLHISRPYSGRSVVEAESSRNFMMAIGKLPQLEHLRLDRWQMGAPELALLAGQNNLKSLTLSDVFAERVRSESDSPLLSKLPALPRLETLDLDGSAIGDRDLRFVAALPQLKSLNLVGARVSSAGLAELASLGFLEELAIGGDAESAAGFGALLQLRRLNRLYLREFDPMPWLPSPEARLQSGFWQGLMQRENEIEDSVRALAALRKAKPRLSIDAYSIRLFWDHEPSTETIPDSWKFATRGSALRAIQAWDKQQASK